MTNLVVRTGRVCLRSTNTRFGSEWPASVDAGREDTKDFAAALTLYCFRDLRKPRNGLPDRLMVSAYLLFLACLDFCVASKMLYPKLVDRSEIASIAGELSEGNGQLDIPKAVFGDHITGTPTKVATVKHEGIRLLIVRRLRIVQLVGGQVPDGRIGLEWRLGSLMEKEYFGFFSRAYWLMGITI